MVDIHTLEVVLYPYKTPNRVVSTGAFIEKSSLRAIDLRIHFFFLELLFMASDGSDQNAEYALSKLLQMGTVAEYETGNTKSPLSVDTFGNNGVDESETSGPETPVKEVVDNDNGSAHFLVGYGTGSEVVTGLPKEFQEGDMVDALSRVLKWKRMSSKGLSHKPIIPSRDSP
nr:hypothetical protein [Tanacetum cinerariifolium]